MFALGFLGAALLAAAIVPLSTAYSVAEAVGAAQQSVVEHAARTLDGAGLLFRTRGESMRTGAGAGSEAAFAAAWNHPTIGSHLRAVLFEQPQQFGATFIGDAAYLKSLTATTLPLTDNFPRRVLPGAPAPES